MSETETTAPPTFYPELLVDLVEESTWNPRKHFNDATLSELADSIREKGVIEPILVRPKAGGRFEIVAGARRHRASLLAGRPTIPALVRDLDDVAALELAVIENGQRDDVHPLDEAEGFAALQRADKRFTVALVAAKVGKSESYVYRRLKLLDLEPALQTALAEDRLSVAHAERLCRLTPAQRADATSLDGSGVVWTHSPLLDYDDDWIPSREDLQPLATLEKFIRDKSHFDPSSEDARHFQPDLAEQLDDVVEAAGAKSDVEADEFDEAAILSSLVSLSEDPMARSRLGVKKGDPVPLTPSHWHEVTKAKDRCEFTVKGVITHGGPARVLDVCVTKRCAKHFPPAPKKPAESATRQPAAPERPSWEEQERERELIRKAWADLLTHVAPAFADHVKRVKFNAALVRMVCDRYKLERVQTTFGIKLTDSTAAQVLLLSEIALHSREDFLADVKPFKFNIGAIEQKLKAAAKKAAAKPARATSAKSTKKTKKGKAA